MSAEQEALKQSEKSPEVDQRSAVLLAAALRQHLLLHQQMGITLYPKSEDLKAFLRPQRRRAQALARPKSPPSPVPAPGRPKAAPKPVAQPAPPKVSAREISTTLQHCSACSLASTRRAQVLGRGKADARLMIVGTYPRCSDSGQWSFGKEEDQLLWKMMQAISLGPEDVYLTNVVKCSPPGEVLPQVEQEQACQGFLYQEIAQVQPTVILAMGKAAARAILGSDVSIFRLRGRLHSTRFTGETGQAIPVMISFHPGFLLEQPAMKRAAWQDLQIVQRLLQQTEKN